MKRFFMTFIGFYLVMLGVFMLFPLPTMRGCAPVARVEISHKEYALLTEGRPKIYSKGVPLYWEDENKWTCLVRFEQPVLLVGGGSVSAAWFEPQLFYDVGVPYGKGAVLEFHPEEEDGFEKNIYVIGYESSEKPKPGSVTITIGGRDEVRRHNAD